MNLKQNSVFCGGVYPYGFQGQELDNEVYNIEGSSLNYEYRMYNTRLGRFFASDPLSSTYPYNSPYAFSENNVIHCLELEGLEKVHVYIKWTDGKGIVHTKYSHTYIDNKLKENVNQINHYDGKGKINKIQFRGSDGKIKARYSGDKLENADYWHLYRTLKSTQDAKKTTKERSQEIAQENANTADQDETPDYRSAPSVGGSLSLHAEANNMPTGGVSTSFKMEEDGPQKMSFKVENNRNIFYMNTSGTPVDASVPLTMDLYLKKPTKNEPTYGEGEISFPFTPFFSISYYQNTNGASGMKFNVGFSTTKSKNPTGTFKIVQKIK